MFFAATAQLVISYPITSLVVLVVIISIAFNHKA